MKKLEGYRVPAHLNSGNKKLSKVPNTLGKIFRDREELPASGSLDSKLLDAIKQSEFLIVICSPDSARSKRVNEEITQFIKYRDSRNVLCYIVEGEPEFGPVTGGMEQDCVSPSLRKLYIQSGQIPVAADARDIGDGASRALQKIIAGLLEVGLDELVRRDARRHHSRLLVITAASVFFTILTTGLLVRANLAESAAHQASLDAQLQNKRAEDLIHFMLEDLVGIKLQQLGRQDVFDAVVEEVAAHYSQQDDSKLGPVNLARKSQAYLQLGRLYFGRNMHKPADELFDYSYRTTTTLTDRYPESADALFAHISSLYWLGLSNIYRGQYTAAEKVWRERIPYGEILLQSDDHSQTVWSNLGDIYVHLGWSLMELGRVNEAYEEFKKGLRLRQENVDRFPEDIGWQNSLAGGYFHMQWAELYLGKNEQAYANARISNEKYEKLADADPTDQRALGNYARSLRWRAEAEIATEQYSEAAKSLRKSVELHKELLDFEPNETVFQFQACVSSVLLVEVLIASDKVNEATKANNAVCGDAGEVLALDHPVVHNRIYGYRHKLAQIKLDLLADHDADAVREYDIIRTQFENETLEVQQSPQGKNITLAIAISAVELNERLHGIPDAQPMLSTAIAAIESGTGERHSATARLVTRAKQLSVQVSNGIDSNALTINF